MPCLWIRLDQLDGIFPLHLRYHVHVLVLTWRTELWIYIHTQQPSELEVSLFMCRKAIMVMLTRYL